ncbi:HEPN-associated N-terminal domain-containing protein [Streptomyces sp. NPDC048349]|uniref:HEPN-associated N-terminal domain-containing protein n=1 Tax=Streptomyces sp. NPDC048349 TaxID=3155486 RepID=UPI00341BD827
MGAAKRQMELEFDRGWSSSGEHVCARCLNEPALQRVISDSAQDDEQCSFCGHSPAAELDVLTGAFVKGLRTEYANADDEGVPYVSAEGGYQVAATWDTWDLVGEYYDAFANERVFEAVRGSIGEQMWTEVGWQLLRYNEQLSSSWQSFCEQIQHKTRYVFWLRRDDADQEEERWGDIPAGRILDQIGRHILDFDLVRELPAGTALWRAREVRDSEVSAASGWGAADLGTAPRQFARTSNRMSPAGIPMFYGSFDQDTAVQEVTRGERRRLAAGAFQLSRSCMVVDFTRLPDIPSMFDLEHGHQRRTLLFLHQFIEQMAKPVRDGYDQIDYVPTQVVAEFLLKVFNPDNPAQGLLYTSSLNGQPCAVFDLDSSRCVEQEAGWDARPKPCLGLIPGSVRVIEANG